MDKIMVVPDWMTFLNIIHVSMWSFKTEEPVVAHEI